VTELRPLDSASIERTAPAVPRSAVLRTVIRALLSSTGVVFLYFVAPLDGRAGFHTGWLLGIGLVVYVALLGWQFRSVALSRTPWLRAVEVLATAAPFLLVLFATIYYLLAHNDATAFSEPLTRLDALYFTVTVFATVGFGDITGRSEAARAVVTVQMALDLLVLGLGLRLLLGAVRRGLSRQANAAADTATPDPARLNDEVPTLDPSRR
jgi:hypothetical protein